MKKILFFVLVGMSLVISSCGKEDDPNLALNKDLSGIWNVTSYIEEGEDLMNDYVSSFTMNFVRDVEMVEKGTSTWILLADGYSDSIMLDYSINETADKIVLSMDGDPLTFDINISGDQLQLDNLQEEIFIKAVRQ